MKCASAPTTTRLWSRSDAHGNPVGLYIDVQQVAARNAWHLTYVNGSWSENLARLRSSKIDFVVLDMAQTQRRLFYVW